MAILDVITATNKAYQEYKPEIDKHLLSIGVELEKISFICRYANYEWYIGLVIPGIAVYAEIRWAQMPNCCGIMVSSHNRYLGNNPEILAKICTTMQKEAARLCGYTRLMYTTIQTMDWFQGILRDAEFQQIEEFKSQRTTNTIQVWSADLLKERGKA